MQHHLTNWYRITVDSSVATKYRNHLDGSVATSVVQTSDCNMSIKHKLQNNYHNYCTCHWHRRAFIRLMIIIELLPVMWSQLTTAEIVHQTTSIFIGRIFSETTAASGGSLNMSLISSSTWSSAARSLWTEWNLKLIKKYANYYQLAFTKCVLTICLA